MPDALSPIYGLVEPELSSTGWGPKINSDLQVLDTLIAYPHVQRKALTIGATTTLNLTEGVAFLLTLTQDTTIAFFGAAVDTATHKPAQRILLAITADGTARTITWDTSIYWLGGVEPVLPETGTVLIEMFTGDNGTTWAAVHVGGFEGLPSDSVSTSKIQNLAVTTAKLADDAVTTVKILDGAVTEAKLAIGAVPRASLGVPQRAKVALLATQTVNPEATLNWVTPAGDPSFDPTTMFSGGSPSLLTFASRTYDRGVMLVAQLRYSSGGKDFRIKIQRADGTTIGTKVESTGSAGSNVATVQAIAVDQIPAGTARGYRVVAFAENAGANQVVVHADTLFSAVEIS